MSQTSSTETTDETGGDRLFATPLASDDYMLSPPAMVARPWLSGLTIAVVIALAIIQGLMSFDVLTRLTAWPFLIGIVTAYTAGAVIVWTVVIVAERRMGIRYMSHEDLQREAQTVQEDITPAAHTV